MSDISSPVFQWLNQNPHWAGLFTFIISAAESIAIIGTIIPGSIMMTAIGTLAGSQIIPLYPTLIWAILGAIAGDSISYWSGRYFNQRLITFWPFRNYPTLLTNGENFFHRHGSMSVFIGRFVGPVRALVPLIAGMLKMRPLRFTLTSICSAIGWAPAYMLPGILLGAASLELPPDLAVHALISLFLTGLFIILCIWSAFQLFHLISKQIEQKLTNIWYRMSHSKQLQPITTLLQHHDPAKRHGQLILGFYFLVTFSLLLCLIILLHYHPAETLSINRIVFHTFRHLRTPTFDNVMLVFTFLGDKKTLLPLIITLTAWFIFKKRQHTAWHIFFLGLITTGAIYVLKHITHSIRPWGILHNPEEFSFPSGHVTLSVVFYFAIFFLFFHINKCKQRKFFFWLTGIFLFLISISRLYLGAHWFTDVLGAWLLGTTILISIILSWNRRAEKPLTSIGMLIVTFLTLSIADGFNMTHHFTQLKKDSTQIGWPVQTTSIQNWWQQQGKDLPFYRINRFGLARQILNLQWVGNLSNIQKILSANHWQPPTQITWIDALHRIANIDSSQHLPLVEPLYLDEPPQLVLIKQSFKIKQLIILRLWEAHLTFKETKLPLWVGTVEVIPSTYSWLFPKQQNRITLTSDILFDQIPTHLTIQQHIVYLKNNHHIPHTILLLKP